jgi:hypothetical protein
VSLVVLTEQADSPEDGSRTSSRNVVSSFLIYLMLEEVQLNSSTEGLILSGLLPLLSYSSMVPALFSHGNRCNYPINSCLKFPSHRNTKAEAAVRPNAIRLNSDHQMINSEVSFNV